jgi:hypothetical protein
VRATRRAKQCNPTAGTQNSESKQGEFETLGARFLRFEKNGRQRNIFQKEKWNAARDLPEIKVEYNA